MTIAARALELHPSALERLAFSSLPLAQLVEACSRRRDVREFRARLVLQVLALSCPRNARPQKPWYVPGALARFGAGGLRRAWAGFHGERAPSERSIRAHLGVLEGAGVLVRSPGEWIPHRAGTWRERRPDTLHLLDGLAESSWWAKEGRRLLDLYPRARRDPGLWRRLFGAWRRRVGALQGSFDFDRPAPRALEVREPERRQELGRAVARRLRGARSSCELTLAIRSTGARLDPRASWALAGDPERTRRALALLAVALIRGDRVRNLAGWLWRAWRCARPEEGALALARCARVSSSPDSG